MDNTATCHQFCVDVSRYLLQNSTEVGTFNCDSGASDSRSIKCSLPLYQVWAKPVANGALALLLVNVANSKDVTVTLDLVDLFNNTVTTAAVRDLFLHTDLDDASGGVVSMGPVPAHGAQMLTVTPKHHQT